MKLEQQTYLEDGTDCRDTLYKCDLCKLQIKATYDENWMPALKSAYTLTMKPVSFCQHPENGTVHICRHCAEVVCKAVETHPPEAKKE